jgi:hypothetical protein
MKFENTVGIMNLSHRIPESIGIHLLLFSSLKTLSRQVHGDKKLNILLPAPLSPVAKSFCDLSLITLKEVEQFYEVSPLCETGL